MKYLKLKKPLRKERKKKKENERRNKSRLEREATNKAIANRHISLDLEKAQT